MSVSFVTVPIVAIVLVFGCSDHLAHAQQPSPDDAAILVLNSGRRAYNEQKFSVAADRFREFVRLAPNHKETPAARYGLALALLETGDQKGALETLQQVSTQDFPDRPLALYHLGVVQRTAGAQALTQAVAKPNESEQLRATAQQRFGEAAKAFTSAADLLAPRAKQPPKSDAGELAADVEWLIRARCDQAEMLLRLNKFNEAAELVHSLTEDAAWSKSRSRPLALYHLGYARFSLQDFLGAGQALSQLAPFQQEFGVHARYLLARTHHLSGELAEAAVQYKAVLNGFDEQKKSAQESLKNPGALRAEQKTALESLVNQPPPEHVVRADFYGAVLLFDEGRQAEAAERFASFAQKNPKSPLASEAQLRQGACFVQLKKFPEALKLLDPLKDHPLLADQALCWLARARVGAADPAKTAEYDQAMNAALDAFRRAAERARQAAKPDADSRNWRLNVLMELADTAVLAKQFKEAITNYETVVAEKSPRAEEAMQRQVTALHLAGQFAEADALAAKFEGAYPKSTLLPETLFRSAESAQLIALKSTNPAEKNKGFEEAVKRYRRVVESYPEFAYVNMARHGLATAYYRLEKYAEAASVLSTIAEADRTGELAAVPYLLGDCLIRSWPPETEDALQAARFIEKAEQAAKLLEGFVTAHEKSPQAPDALLKLGHCYQRVGALMAAAGERKKLLTSARDAYDRALKLFGKEPIQSVALFERAKCLALLGETNEAIGVLGQFQNAPLNASPNAPLALLRLSTLLRAQGKATDAVNTMNHCVAKHEGALLNDPARINWAAMIRSEQALAVKESGKLSEARSLFEAIAKQFAGQLPALNASWRVSQCRREEAVAELMAARKAAAKPGATPEEVEAATKRVIAQTQGLRDIAANLEQQAQQIGQAAAGSEAHLRMFYEVAWCHRTLAKKEIEAARQKTGAGALPSTIPLQPAEQLAMESYRKIVALGPDSMVAIEARCELAEMHAARDELDHAIELLGDALEKNPAPELATKIRLGLATAYLARQNPKQALAYVQPMLPNPANAPASAEPVRPAVVEANYLAGEALIQQEDWQRAIKQLLPFRDDEKFRNAPGISDRALLRLGHAFGQAYQWDVSRQTLETLVQRFPQSPWIDEARYGIGWAWQNQKNFDNAVNSYAEVTKRTAAEVAAKAQLQIGLCRLEQKRYEEAANALLAVAYTYDYAEWSAPARCEAARAQMELKRTAEAAHEWQQVMNDYPKSPWADVARKRLAELKPQ